MTQEDALFETWLRRREDLPPDLAEDRMRELREAFFSRSRACLRASPLPKRHSWVPAVRRRRPGRALPDGVGGVPAARRGPAGGAGGVRVLKAMRSRRT
ncbi:DUF6157 family protein [Microbispora sp. ATCC PTA-5024]|uniref:DUF6157 family protein n=1 Tax=Microbispora sp. ATCC PTA-5024 TaxID=316330 RepID=UPI003FA59143